MSMYLTLCELDELAENDGLVTLDGEQTLRVVGTGILVSCYVYIIWIIAGAPPASREPDLIVHHVHELQMVEIAKVD